MDSAVQQGTRAEPSRQRAAGVSSRGGSTLARAIRALSPCAELPPLSHHLLPPPSPGLRDERDLSIAVRLGCGALAGTLGQARRAGGA